MTELDFKLDSMPRETFAFGIQPNPGGQIWSRLAPIHVNTLRLHKVLE